MVRAVEGENQIPLQGVEELVRQNPWCAMTCYGVKDIQERKGCRALLETFAHIRTRDQCTICEGMNKAPDLGAGLKKEIMEGTHDQIRRVPDHSGWVSDPLCLHDEGTFMAQCTLWREKKLVDVSSATRRRSSSLNLLQDWHREVSKTNRKNINRRILLLPQDPDFG